MFYIDLSKVFDTMDQSYFVKLDRHGMKGDDGMRENAVLLKNIFIKQNTIH